MFIVKLQFRSEARRNWPVEQSRTAEGAIPHSLLRNIFPKLALGFVPVILLSPDILILRRCSASEISEELISPIANSLLILTNPHHSHKNKI